MEKNDYVLIDKIVNRARELGIQCSKLNLMMDITTAYNNIPLKLEEWFNADNFDFLHDVIGIINNLNRGTLKLENYFLPRYADIKKR